VLDDALARHIIIVIVYNMCVFVTPGTYHIKITYSTWYSFHEIVRVHYRAGCRWMQDKLGHRAH